MWKFSYLVHFTCELRQKLNSNHAMVRGALEKLGDVADDISEDKFIVWNKWMNEWMNVWMNEWMNEWVNEWIYLFINKNEWNWFKKHSENWLEAISYQSKYMNSSIITKMQRPIVWCLVLLQVQNLLDMGLKAKFSIEKHFLSNLKVSRSRNKIV